MSKHPHFKFTTDTILYPLFFVLLIWMSFWVQIRFHWGWHQFGIVPRTFEGLRGVVFSPLLHSDVSHLYHNSVPLFLFSVAVFYFYRNIAWKVIVYGILLSGLITWCIGRPANHIGASGLIYVLASFIFFKGVFARHFRLIALSLVIVFLYGSMIWYVFPIKEGMSWEGHLAGLITGIGFALVFRKNIAKPKKYDWELPNYNEEEDAFLKHFDADGNFIEIEPEPPSPIHYDFKKEQD